jgi:hypothetical protein
MHAGVGLSRVAAAIHAYPTFSEIARKLGDAHQRRRLTPFVRRAFAWLYRWHRRGLA